MHAALQPTLRSSQAGGPALHLDRPDRRGRRRAGPGAAGVPRRTADGGRGRGVARGAAGRPRRSGRGGRCGRSRRCGTHPRAGRGRSASGRRTSPRWPRGPLWRGRRPTRRCAAVVVRYLEGFGPASVADVAQFTLVQRSRARAALQALAGELERLEGPDGKELFDVPGAPRPDEDTPGAAPADGHVGQHPAGLRRPQPRHPARLPRRSSPASTATSCRRCWSTATWPASGARSTAASRRPPSTALPTRSGRASPPRPAACWRSSPTATRRLYRRYDHWWSRLPPGEVRLLTG